MKEQFLQQVWQLKLINNNNLYTTKGEKIIIEDIGKWNYDSGPDFLTAKIKIEKTLWVGNVEIHVRSSDWEKHNHSKNPNYQNIILHVVYEDDQLIPFLEEKNIPTLVLKDYIPKNVLFNYHQLLEKPSQFIPCENSFKRVDESHKKLWLERLFFNRLEEKSYQIQQELRENKNDWEQLLFKKLAYAFGLKINADVFLHWANSFPFSVLQKVQQKPLSVEALFLGQAGFLIKNSNDEYIKSLVQEYTFLQSKYQLKAINSNDFKFFRLRPSNFPTIRIAQLAALYGEYNHPFSLMMGTKSVNKIQTMLSNIVPHSFWDNHYTIEKTSSKNQPKKISQQLIFRLIINVIVPIKYTYSKQVGKLNSEEIIEMLEQLPKEENTIINRFNDLKANILNAMDSQAYLELKKQFCDAKKCLNCDIGIQLLKNE